MTVTVIAVSAGQVNIARHLLPETGRIAKGGGRFYFFYQTNGGNDYGFTDLDGSPLIESHSFETLAQADAWVRRDIRRVQ